MAGGGRDDPTGRDGEVWDRVGLESYDHPEVYSHGLRRPVPPQYTQDRYPE